MSNLNQIVPPTTITDAAVSYLQVSPKKVLVLTKITLSNLGDLGVSAEDTFVSVHVVPSGGSADNTNLIVNEETVPAGKTIQLSVLQGQVLKAGDSLFVQSDKPAGTVAVNLMVSGMESQI